MDYNSMFSLIDLMVLAFGFYALYSAFVLHKDGKVIRTFLVFKDTDINDCKDLQGYANFMAPKLYTLGAIMIAYGVISMLNTYVVEIPTLFAIMMIGFLIVLIWYALEVKKALKKYF